MRLARKYKSIQRTATESAVLADFPATLANNRELYLTDVCRQLADEYLAGPQQQLLGQYLNVKQSSTKSIVDILLAPCQTKQQAEVVKVLSYFLQGELDSISTARLLCKLCREQQPFSWKVWRLGDKSRAKKLAQFVNNFKAQCVKDIIENFDSNDFASSFGSTPETASQELSPARQSRADGDQRGKIAVSPFGNPHRDKFNGSRWV